MLLTSDLVYVPIVLATAYLLTTLFILLSLHTSKQLFFTLSLRKLFSYSCLMLCCLRVTAFTSMACLNAYSSSSRADDDSVLPNSSNHILFEKAMLVLFDLPDYCFLGAYLLLLLKWGDVFMLSRRHWLNDHSYRTSFVLAYVICNGLLYATQISLYSLLFLPKVDQGVLAALIYFTLAVINFGVPILWVIAFLFLSLQFSGFPNANAAALSRYIAVSNLCGLWTASRILWAVLSLTTVLRGWFRHTKSSMLVKSISMICVFLALEILPIVIAISRMKLLGGKETDSSDAIKPSTSLNKGNYFQLGSIWDELENGDAISPPSSSSSSYTTYKISSNSRIYSKVIRDMAITTPPRGNTPQVLSPIKGGTGPLSPIGSFKRLKPSFVNPTASEHRRSPPSFVSYDDQVS